MNWKFERSDYMLPKIYKLSRQDLQNLGKKENEHHTPHFICRVYTASTPPSKYTVVISSKVAKKAVVRNKIRRRVYSIVSKCADFSCAVHVVFVVKKGAPSLSFQNTQKEITQLLSKAGIFHT